MEDVTDAVFRNMCRQFGAAMVYTEFVSADALVRSVKKTLGKMKISEDERPVVIQIYGKDPDTMADAAKIVEEYNPDIIDINFGCPVRKIAQKGAGAGLLRDVPLMLKITEKVVQAVKTPVTVKTRLGWASENIIIKDIAIPLQNCGIKALTIHGRTREQMYSGMSDWSYIREVKEMADINIPIIGNGDITTGPEADRAFKDYKVDAIMVGRASIGAPWIFKEITHYFEHGEEMLISSLDKIEILKNLLKENCDMCGERRGILHTRRHLAMTPVFKGLENFRQRRVAILRADTLQKLIDLLNKTADDYFSKS